MAESKIVSLIAQLLPVQQKVVVPQVKECRKYASSLTVDVTIRGRMQSVSIPICYEIENAFEWITLKGDFKAHDFTNKMVYGPATASMRYPTCELARNALSQIKPKNALVPSWEFFNFNGLVCVLGGMLGVLTIAPNLTTADFRGKKPYVIKGINQMSDLTTIMDEGNVYIDPRFTLGQNNNVLWTVATAANIAGARVIIPFADSDSDGRVVCRELGGPQLINGITTALNLLGTYYSLSNCGDVFALALTRGLHRVISVVGHSDEGGITRDLLRLGGYAPPFGGLPAGISASSGMPIIDGHYYEELCAVADSLLLTTAAIVAHCDPMTEVDGDYYPTILTVSDEEVTSQPPASKTQRAKALASMYAANISSFAMNYSKGLARLLNLQCEQQDPLAAHELIQAASLLASGNSSHFEQGSVLVPYFWIEPTTVLPKKLLGTAAEQYGSASLAGWGEKPVEDLFPGATALGASDTYQSDWAIDFKSARTVPFILYAQNHWKDGLANLLMKGFDSGRLALTKMGTAQIMEKKDEKGYIDPSELLWTRGQSKIPHPGEFLNLDGRMSVTIIHNTINSAGLTRPVAHLPRCDEVHTTRVTYVPSRLRYYTTDRANCEDAGVKRLRTRGVRALEEAQYQVLRVVKLCGPGAQAVERPPPRTSVRREAVETNNTTLEPGLQMAAVPATLGSMPTPDVERVTKSEPVPVARQHGTLIAPKPGEIRPSGDGLPDAGVPRVNPADGPIPADADGLNQQVAAPDQVGAAPGQ